ncbi:MAG TPA: response regulator [Steroidobacteraceae bacterium]
MSSKRALIVDDSKSARVFLSRILEKYELEVDTTENAELAIEYLIHHRPDVIFMDHLMPGMDGFQALQAIKNNPQTATIPIMMYTSQEGELYLGQARALGAVGVLPKQIKQADVSKVLYQLHLVADRRTSTQSSFRPLTVDPLQAASSAETATGAHALLTEAALREHLAELRHALTANIDNRIDSQFERLSANLRTMLQDALPLPATPGLADSEPYSWGWTVAIIACVAAIVSTALWRQEVNLNEARGAHGAALVIHAPAKPPPARVDNAQKPAAPVVVRPIIETVPYGEDPLGGVRLERVSQLLERLAAEKYRGVVEIKSFPGRFCLVGNATDGYSLAPDELPFAKCDLVSSPRDGIQQGVQRVSLPFANLLSAIRHTTNGTLDVQLAPGDAAVTLQPYPQVSADLTAGQWNRAGSANNRIEIRLP